MHIGTFLGQMPQCSFSEFHNFLPLFLVGIAAFHSSHVKLYLLYENAACRQKLVDGCKLIFLAGLGFVRRWPFYLHEHFLDLPNGTREFFIVKFEGRLFRHGFLWNRQYLDQLRRHNQAQQGLLEMWLSVAAQLKASSSPLWVVILFIAKEGQLVVAFVLLLLAS